MILGGTGDARDLAAALSERFGPALAVTTSLAGRTRTPARVAGAMRSGGFGGAEGLARHIRDTSFDLVIDATHPFAQRISDHARSACAAEATPLLALERSPWTPSAGDRWHQVADARAAARLLPSLGHRVFLTIGRNVSAFTQLSSHWFLVRLIDPPAVPLPLATHKLVIARAPFTVDGEVELMRSHRIDVLVTKASGGRATEAKLAAARALKLPVLLIERPRTPADAYGARVDSVAAALDWIADHIAAPLDAAPQRPDHGRDETAA